MGRWLSTSTGRLFGLLSFLPISWRRTAKCLGEAWALGFWVLEFSLLVGFALTCWTQVVWQVLQAELPGGYLFTGTCRCTGRLLHRFSIEKPLVPGDCGRGQVFRHGSVVY